MACFVVLVGELERWVTAVGGHGPAWIAEVLNQGLLYHAEAARTFMVEIAGFLSQ
jgi:hypothetical protein